MPLNDSDFDLALATTAIPVTVKNELPEITTKFKLAVIGEAPGPSEAQTGQPFSGGSGRVLWNALGRYGVARQSCFVGNVSQEVGQTEWNSGYVQSGLAALTETFQTYRPNLVLLLGATALRSGGGERTEISQWRGSLFTCTDTSSPFFGLKCMSALHPAAVCRDWSEYPIFSLDCRRAADESTFPELNLPQRELVTNLSVNDVLYRLESLGSAPLVALDIEGGVRGISVISFADSPSTAFSVPLGTYTDHELGIVLPAVARFLSSRTPKVLQHSLYDNFVLTHCYKMPIANVVKDTMLSGWQLYPELLKGLGVQASIWTKEPYYKFEKTSHDLHVLHKYCCRDSAVTIEIAQEHEKQFQTKPHAGIHNAFNVSLLRPLLYMELRGIRYDRDGAATALAKVVAATTEIVGAINRDYWTKVPQATKPKGVNPASPKQVKEFLYEVLRLPKQFGKTNGRVDKTKVSTDTDALLALKNIYSDLDVLDNILAWRKADKQRVALEATADPDGRIRCSYNLVGTETGRMSCSESPTQSGYNLQTVTAENRRLFLADEGKYFFQCDLSGADVWTVSSWAARLGDSRMLDDCLAGLKPAKIIALLYRHGQEVNTWPTEKLREASKTVSEKGPDGWLYFACKRVMHGSNYGLGVDNMVVQILKDSYKKMEGQTVTIAKSDAAKLQSLYLSRYPGVKSWQARVKNEILSKGTLDCASGHVRRFFGRREDHATILAALAHEPQANTTYATNLALRNLWLDPENRRGPHLRIEPLHQVHDALCGQFDIVDADWAVGKIRQWFNNPITIAGRTITIPFEGGYGSSWGDLKNAI